MDVPDEIGEHRYEDSRVVIPFRGHLAERRSGEAAHFTEFALEIGGDFFGGRCAASKPRRERQVLGGIGDFLWVFRVGIEEMSE